ncbi:MAG: hypothetical protein KDB80_15385 [Planctomycetes bacterium]|nr:hypothetical protein [Planctomycetota bacterium]
MRLALGWIGIVLASSVAAQGPVVSGLESDDPIEVESARRMLVLADASEFDADRVRDVLGRGDDRQRAAAASVIVHHGLTVDGWQNEPAARVRAILVRGATDADCRVAVRDDAHDVVAAAAFLELARRGRVDSELYESALTRHGSETARCAAQHLVACAVPLPFDVLAKIATDRAAQAPVLEALVWHPRPSAVPWLEELAEARESAAAKLEVYAAFPCGALTASHGRSIVAAAGNAPVSLVREAADRLSPDDADRLVGAIHQRAEEGLEISLALELLSRITERGERMLIALARVAEPADLKGILDWLARRDSSVVDTLVRDALAAPEPVPTFLLRRAGRVVDDPELRARVVSMLGSSDPERASAAFHALIHGGQYSPGLLEFVFAAESDVEEIARRARALFELPLGVLDDAAWTTLLEAELPAVRIAAMRRLFRRGGALRGAREAYLMRLAREPDAPGLVAARLVASLGRSGSVLQMWGGLDAERRKDVASALADREEPWALPLLVDDDLRDSPEFRAARVALGDRTEIDALLAEPARWSAKWLRRRDEVISRAIEERHLDGLAKALFGPAAADSWVRLEVVGWLVRRPDLPVGGLLDRAYREDDDIGVQELALEGLLLHREGAAICERVDAAVGTPLDEDTIDLAHAIVGAARAPLTAAAARSVARILLVAPVGDAREEIAAHLDLDPGAAPPGMVIINMAMHLLREDTSDVWVAAMTAAGRELEGHANRFATGRARLGRILTELARDREVRRQIAPVVARLVLASPDASTEFVAPAKLILAERAYERGDWATAAAAFEGAELAWIADSPVPQVARVFLADDDPGAGSIPSAWLAARPDVCRARLAFGRGDAAAASEFLERAAELAHGDRSSESEIRSLREEVRK